MSVDKRNVYDHFCCGRNWRVCFSWEIVHATPQIVSRGISETRPISQACQRVTSLIDLKLSARSSEREQRILAALRSVKRALLHRERVGALNRESIYPDSVIL